MLHLLAVALAGWVNRHRQAVTEYIIEENRVFKRQVRGRRLRLSNDGRGAWRQKRSDSGVMSSKKWPTW